MKEMTEVEERENRIRKAARKRLMTMEKAGNIKDWDFLPKKDVYYVTLLTGEEIELSSTQIKFFQLGILCAIYQASGSGEIPIKNLLRGMKTI